MKKYIVLLCLSLMVALTACAEAPQEVKDNMEQYGDNGAINKKEVSYCNIAELKNVNSQNIDVADSNIILPENIDFSEVKNIYNLDFQFTTEYSSNTDALEKQFGMGGKKDYQDYKGTLDGDSVKESRGKP